MKIPGRLGQGDDDREILGIESGLEALQLSSEFQGVVEPIEEQGTDHDFCEHFALIYETEEERLSSGLPFIRQGLERGDRCISVIDKDAREDLLGAMRDVGVDVDTALESGTLSFKSPREMYLQSGSFDPDEMVDFYGDVIEDTVEEFEGLRVIAGTEWVLDEDVTMEKFLEYEARVNTLFREVNAIGMCQYDRSSFPSDVLCDIIRTHPHLIYKNTVCHNFYYVPPEEFLGPEHSDHEINRMVRTLLDRTEARVELQRTMNALRESNNRLQEFAHIASHDLQEPLRMVSSYLQLLENRYQDELDEEAEEFIDFAVSGADRMRDMIDDLLAYSRLGNRDATFDQVDCTGILEQVRIDLRMQIDESDAEILYDSLPTLVADGTQLELLFQNLISNAIKYQDERPPRIEVDATNRGDRWEFAVSDNGIGIDPDNTDKIFQVFESLHGGDEFSGTGIGLALCQKTVSNHGGEIWAESEPGAGSTFYFTIPKGGDR